MDKVIHSRTNEIFQDSRFKNVERESSQQVLRNTEKSSERIKVRSQSKFILNNDDQNKSKRIEILHQIQQKLAMKHRIHQRQEEPSLAQLRGRVQRLEQLMGQIKKERQFNQQPKTVFVRENLQTYLSQNQIVNNPNLNANDSSFSKIHLQMMLKEIQSARMEVRDIRSFNERISRMNGRQKNSKSKNVEPFNQLDSKAKICNSPPLMIYPSKKFPERTEEKRNELKQTMIYELEKIPDAFPASKASLGSSQGFNSMTVVNDIPNSQLYYPSEVMFSWKKENSNDDLHRLSRQMRP